MKTTACVMEACLRAQYQMMLMALCLDENKEDKQEVKNEMKSKERNLNEVTSTSGVNYSVQGFPPIERYKDAIIRDQPVKISLEKTSLPVYTVDWSSRKDPYFMPATGLDFLFGVPEVAVLRSATDLSSTECRYVVKVPNGETLYLGSENSTILQKTLFRSQRSFSLSLLDPNKQEAAVFQRRASFTNFSTCFRQEMIVTIPENNTIGRIIQNRGLSTISFTVFDGSGKDLYTINSSRNSYFYTLDDDVYFSIIDQTNRTGGFIVHKWDEAYSDLMYQITFPSNDTTTSHKMLLIGATLLIEFTYFKKTGCFLDII